jgi:hypothetical protein
MRVCQSGEQQGIEMTQQVLGLQKSQRSLLMSAAMRIFCTLASKPYCNEPRRYCDWRNNNKTISNLCNFLWCFYLQLDQLKQRLSHVRECIGDANMHLLPMEDGINIDKLGQLGTITTNTCNNAQKQSQLLSLHIQGKVIKQDCHHHLWNVWAKAVKIALSKYLTVMLRDSLNTIDSSLWVSTVFTPFARVYDKEFSLAANYPKGHGELFTEWMKENYPGELLFHVESTHGSRQDSMFKAALAIAMYRLYNIEFVDYCLWMSDKKDHVLQRSLFVVLSSIEMAAQA